MLALLAFRLTFRHIIPATWILAASLLLPSVVRAQLQINLAGSSWNDQTLKSATIKATGATTGNNVSIIIINQQGVAKCNLRSAVADNNGEVTITLPVRLIPGGGGATYDYAAGDRICVLERPPGGPPIPPAVAKISGQLKVNGGVQDDGPCPEPQRAAVQAECQQCDAALTAIPAPGLSRGGTLLLVLLVSAMGVYALRRRHAQHAGS